MGKFGVFIFLTFICFTLHGEDELVKLYMLTEDVRDVIIKAPGGHPMPEREFELTTAQSDQMAALASVDDSMKVFLETSSKDKDCDQSNFYLTKTEMQNLAKRVNDRSFHIEALVFSNDKQIEKNAVARFDGDDYMTLMSSLYRGGNYRAYDVYNVAYLKATYKRENPGNNLDVLSLSEQESVLSSFAEKYLEVKLPKGLLMKEMAYSNLIENSADWKKTLTEAKDKLSNEQKIQLVSKLGGRFGDLYNYERLDEGDKAHGKFINAQQLLDSLKNGVPGGVCRDIALAQTQFLNELGFKNNYVVAYKTIGGNHATVISTDPETGKVIKFNYNEVTESAKGSGTEALSQETSMPDYGLKFRIYDTSGKSVTKVPSELGQILKETSGNESDREFLQKNYSLSKVGFSTPLVDGNLFTGKTSTGLSIYGVALYKEVVDHENLKLNLGASFSKVTGERTTVKMDQHNLYWRANGEISSPGLKLGNMTSKVFAGADVSYLLANNYEESLETGKKSESLKTADQNYDYKAGVQNTYVTSDKKTIVDNKVYLNFYPDWNHVATAEKEKLVADSIVVKTGVSHAFTDETKALVDTAIIMKKYGTNIVVKAILEDANTGMRYVAGGSAPLTKNMPTFLPGGERRVFFAAEKESKNLVFSIEVEKNLDNKSKNIMLKGKYKF